MQFKVEMFESPNECALSLNGFRNTLYYGDYCYLPLYAFVGDIPLWAQLRTSDHSAAEGVVPALEKIGRASCRERV